MMFDRMFYFPIGNEKTLSCMESAEAFLITWIWEIDLKSLNQ